MAGRFWTEPSAGSCRPAILAAPGRISPSAAGFPGLQRRQRRRLGHLVGDARLPGRQQGRMGTSGSASDLRKHSSVVAAGFSDSRSRVDYLRTAGGSRAALPRSRVAAGPEVAGRRVRGRACSIAQRRESALDSTAGHRIIGGERTGLRHAIRAWPSMAGRGRRGSAVRAGPAPAEPAHLRRRESPHHDGSQLPARRQVWASNPRSWVDLLGMAVRPGDQAVDGPGDLAARARDEVVCRE